MTFQRIDFLNKLYRIFFGIMVLTIFFIHPVMFLNDEWISGNQLHQLNNGSQILYSEGKYGSFVNGTPFKYFETRNNSLPYTTYLPLFSLPILWIISIIGNHLPYILTILWFILLFFLIINLGKIGHNEKKSQLIFFLTGTIFFIFNLFFYNPFIISDNINYIEILAITLYHILLYSIFCILAYSTILSFNNDDRKTLLGTIIAISCTSALFWTTTLKDHLDSIFFVSLLLYCIILHVKTKETGYLFSGFLVSGLIFWIRPEYGGFVFLTILLAYYPIILYETNKSDHKNFVKLIFTPIGALIGAIPLFLNNLFVMGHPLKFPWELASTYSIVNNKITTSLTANVSNLDISFGANDIFHNIISLILRRMTPDGDVIQGIFSAFLYPEMLKVPVFALTPLFLLMVLLLPMIIPTIKEKITHDDKILLIFLTSISLFTILAYFTSLSGLSTSKGIYPDVRYLSPIYLPLNLIGLIFFMKLNIRSEVIQKIIKLTIGIITAGTIFVIVTTALFHSQFEYSDYFLWINVLTSVLVFSSLLISFILLSLNYLKIFTSDLWFIPFSCMIAIPMIWQLSQLIIINYADNLFEQYPPLLPAVRAFFEYVTANPPT